MLTTTNGAKFAVVCVLACALILSCGIPAGALSTKVHAQYYPWYGNPTVDGTWFHWEGNGHNPPDDLCAAFYPQLGAYSSADANTINQHMKWLADAGVGVICIDWWGPGDFIDTRTPLIMTIANDYGIKCDFMIDNRAKDATWYKNCLIYIIDTYGSMPSFFRDSSLGNRPVFSMHCCRRVPVATSFLMSITASS